MVAPTLVVNVLRALELENPDAPIPYDLTELGELDPDAPIPFRLSERES